MARIRCKTLLELRAVAEADCANLLGGSIADYVKDTLLDHIGKDIYDKYTPVDGGYQRRTIFGMSGGDFIVSEVNNLVLSVKDTTPGNTPIGDGYTPSGTQLMEIIETGAQGHGKGYWKNAFARPALSNARAEVEKGDKIKSILKNFYGSRLQ